MVQNGKDLVMRQAELSTNKEFKVITNSGYYQNSVMVSIACKDASVEKDETFTYEIDKKDAKLLIAFLQMAFDL